jgi:hypothetical protein
MASFTPVESDLNFGREPAKSKYYSKYLDDFFKFIVLLRKVRADLCLNLSLF